MFFKIRSFLSNLCVLLVEKGDSCEVNARIYKNSVIKKSYKAEFPIKDGKIVDDYNLFLKKHSKEVHSTYCAIVLSSVRQWAVPVDNKEGYERFSISIENSSIVKMPGGWSIFTAKDELKDLIKIVNDTEINLVYSPFAILFEKIKENSTKKGVTLYIYVEKSNSTMLVFDDFIMKFGEFYNHNIQNKKKEDEEIDIIKLKDFDDILEGEEAKLQELSGIEPLDNVVPGDYFSDIQSSEDIGEQSEEELEMSVEKSGRTISLVEFIKGSVSNFYSSTLCDSVFIDNITVFDACGLIENNFYDLIYDEFLIKPVIKRTDIIDDTMKLIKRDLHL